MIPAITKAFILVCFSFWMPWWELSANEGDNHQFVFDDSYYDKYSGCTVGKRILFLTRKNRSNGIPWNSREDERGSSDVWTWWSTLPSFRVQFEFSVASEDPTGNQGAQSYRMKAKLQRSFDDGCRKNCARIESMTWNAAINQTALS